MERCWPLPESRRLSCARPFAVCRLSGTRQKGPYAVCLWPRARQQQHTQRTGSLPCVPHVTHGKALISQVPSLANMQPSTLADSRQHQAAAVSICRVSDGHTRQSQQFAVCPLWSTRQTILCRVLRMVHMANYIYFFISRPSNFFCSPHTTCDTPCWNLKLFRIYFFHFQAFKFK
jgi:hypothetical protein